MNHRRLLTLHVQNTGVWPASIISPALPSVSLSLSLIHTYTSSSGASGERMIAAAVACTTAYPRHCSGCCCSPLAACAGIRCNSLFHSIPLQSNYRMEVFCFMLRSFFPFLLRIPYALLSVLPPLVCSLSLASRLHPKLTMSECSARVCSASSV